MDQLNALTNILEYNYQFKDLIIHNCPCYKTEYGDFSSVCIENKSYLACIVVRKNATNKIMHLKLPIVFGSLIDYTIRGPENVTNYNQFGCLYLDGCLKVIYNFISNNLTHGHVYSNKKTGEEVFKVDIDDEDFALHMKYNQKNEHINASVINVKYDKKRKLEKGICEVRKIIEKEEKYNEEVQYHKRKRQKTKIQKSYEKMREEFEVVSKQCSGEEEEESTMRWIDLINRKAKAILGMENFPYAIDFDEEEYIELFNAYLKHAPKLDDISNKVNRTLAYIMHRALMHNIDSCYLNDKELKNLNPKLTNMFKNGNMYFTLAQYLNTENKLVKGFKSIYQNIEAQKINFGALLTSTIKRSVNDSIKNSKALMYPVDGYEFTCPIDSREMKGAGENVMLSQLVIIPIGISIVKVVTFLDTNRDRLSKTENEGDPILQCVINSFLQPFQVANSKLLLLKEEFPTLSLMIFDRFLVINTSGYNQMKYSVKYRCFMNTHEYSKIWPDAFEDYHPHLTYNNCAMFLPESIELGLPAKLTVANANVRGRCLDINNVFELMLFLHTNGASNAAIVHAAEKGDAKALVCFENKRNKNDYMIILPIKLKDAQMRYLKISSLGLADKVPDSVRMIHENYHPCEDRTEAYGLTMDNVIENAKEITDNIYDILFKLYENDTRLEFVNTLTNHLKVTDDPLIAGKEQIIYDNKMHHLRCYVRSNCDLQQRYRECLQFDTRKRHPPHMYIYSAFGDVLGGTNEDGIVIDEKLVKYGPKKLISQTLNITYKDESGKKDQNANIAYFKNGNIIGSNILFGQLDSNVRLTFSKTKNTNISEVFIKPSTYQYKISVENVSNYKKYISSTFSSKNCSINIHYSYLVPIGIGTKLSTGHGQKGVVCKIEDLSNIKGYTKKGEVVHPLILFSPTSILGRTMSSQVMSMFNQEGRAFTAEGVLVSPHGINIHNIDPSNKSKISEVKNDLMTTENGFLTNNLSYMMKVLSDQRGSLREKDKHKLHFVKQLCGLQGVVIKLLRFDQCCMDSVVSDDNDDDDDDE